MKKIIVSLILFLLLGLFYEIYVRSQFLRDEKNDFSAHKEYRDLNEIFSYISNDNFRKNKSIVFVGNSHTLNGVDAKKIESLLSENYQHKVKVYNLSFSTLSPISVLSLIYENKIKPDLIVLDLSFRSSFLKRDNKIVHFKQTTLINEKESAFFLSQVENKVVDALKNHVISLTWNQRLSKKIKNFIFSSVYHFYHFDLEPSELIFNVHFKERELGGNLKASIDYPLGKKIYLENFHSLLCQNEINSLMSFSQRFSSDLESPLLMQLRVMLKSDYQFGLIRLPLHTCLKEEEKRIFSRFYEQYYSISLNHKQLRFFKDFNLSVDQELDLDPYFYDPDHLNAQGAQVFADRLVELIYKNR